MQKTNHCHKLRLRLPNYRNRSCYMNVCFRAMMRYRYSPRAYEMMSIVFAVRYGELGCPATCTIDSMWQYLMLVKLEKNHNEFVKSIGCFNNIRRCNMICNTDFSGPGSTERRSHCTTNIATAFSWSWT